jgi:hypothetical protein
MIDEHDRLPMPFATSGPSRNYSMLREGDVEPVLGKTIDTLISKGSNHIVYLDDELYVEWAGDVDWPEGGGDIINPVSELAVR